MKRSKGFTLVELLVVVGIIALLVTILMPTLGRAMELARRSICGANLNTIGKGIHIYLAEHEKFPLRSEFGIVGQAVSYGTQNDDIWHDDLTDNAMQNVWLLIKAGTSEKAFQCPSDKEYQERKKQGNNDLKKYGWVDRKNYSFGLQKPYQQVQDGDTNKAPLTMTPQGNFVIMTDKNVGGRVYWKSDNDCNKPTNHKEDGFNCLTYQGSVKFHKTPTDNTDANSRAGISNDDVYEAGDEDGTNYSKAAHLLTSDPTDDTDTFIVPWK